MTQFCRGRQSDGHPVCINSACCLFVKFKKTDNQLVFKTGNGLQHSSYFHTGIITELAKLTVQILIVKHKPF